MKKLLFISAIFTFFLANPAIAQISEASFPVSGNCSMCKKRIETAVDVKGVKSADWDMQTKVLHVKYKANKIQEEELKKLVAKAGYDTPGFTADSAAYQNLPGCCQYREGEKHNHPHH